MLDPHPAPEVPARPITDADDLPRNAKALLRKADALGLTSYASYARGTELDGETVTDSILVRLVGDDFMAVVSWWRRPHKRYGYETGYVWRRDGDRRVHLGYRGIVAAIEALAGDGA